MKKLKLLWLGGLLSLLLAACGGESQATPAPTSNQTTIANLAPATPAPVPTATPAPTPTDAPPTATPVPTALPTAGPPVVGVLAAPPDGRKLNFTLAMLQALQKKLGGRYSRADLTTLSVGAYVSQWEAADVLAFYRQNLTAQGWTETHAYDNRFGIYFEKGGQVAAVSAPAIPDELTVNFLAGFVPQVKGQIHGGETLVMLGQGPAKTFEILRKS